MNDLVELLTTLKTRMIKHEAKMLNNETATRYGLIDPLLRALGWNLEDLEIVVPEENIANKHVDYKMANRMIIEAKSLKNTPMNTSKNKEQLFDYMKTSNIKYGILTNGNEWFLYDRPNMNSSPKTDFIIKGELSDVLPKILTLHKNVVMSVETIKKQEKLELDKIEPDPPPISNVELLTECVPITGYRKIKQVKMPTGEEVSVKNWLQMMVEITKWLLNNGLPQEAFPNNGNKLYIMNLVPEHNHTAFRNPHQVSDIWLELNCDPKTAVKKSIELIKHAGQKPEEFKLLF